MEESKTQTEIQKNHRNIDKTDAEKLKTLIESLQTEVANHKSNVRIVDVFSGAFKSNITKKRNDYTKLINPNEVGTFLVSQILNRNSFIQDKIYIKRDIY